MGADLLRGVHRKPLEAQPALIVVRSHGDSEADGAAVDWGRGAWARTGRWPEGAGDKGGGQTDAALAHAPDIQGVGGKLRPGIVHRLDKDTSGLILIAKNDQSHRWLQNQFRDRLVDKTYLALVDGAAPTRQGRIEAAIGRDPAHRKKLAVVPSGKGRLAINEFRTLEEFSEHTLLEVHPITGRTHQIRLHLAYLGCPVTGDTVYGRRKSSLPLTRHFLHAARLMIQLPGEKSPRVFEATLPVDLNEALNVMPKQSVVAEIGFGRDRFSDFSSRILSITNPRKLCMINTWPKDGSYVELLKIIEHKFRENIQVGQVSIEQGHPVIVLENYCEWLF